MSSINVILRKVLSNNTHYCCLCLKSMVEQDSSFIIHDEVALHIDETKEMCEILSNVLGKDVLNKISTHTICKLCTETALNCYRFIQRCTTNINELHCGIESLQKYISNIKEETNDFKALFVALTAHNYGSADIYYEKSEDDGSSLPSKRFQNILNKSKHITIDFEPDYIENYRNNIVKREKLTNILQTHQLSDIVHDTNGLNNYKCKSCLKIYPTENKLKQHYLRVHAPKDFKCSQCSRSFGTSLLLKRHTKDSHCTVVCSQCGKTYTNTYSLRHHERSHRLRLVCQTCGKVYKGKQAFNNHIKMQLCEKMRKSNAEAKFTCDYCQKKYSQKTALSVHIRLEHENGKAVTCDWCSKKFSSISRLRDHIIKHTKQKNFNCEMCGGKFVSKASLLYHTRTHTGEKPYKCEQCEMTFLSASRRSEHVKRHHMGTVYECDICHGKFKGNTCLIRHKKKHFDVSSRLYQKPIPVDVNIN